MQFQCQSQQINDDSTIGATITYSCIQDWGAGGAGNIQSEPCFVDLGYWDPNGTVEDANDDFWVNGDYHVQWDSPRIDAGDPNFCDDPNEHDIDDEPRVMAGRVDIRADEVGPKQADLSRVGLINFKDYSILIQSFGSVPADPNWYVLSMISAKTTASTTTTWRFSSTTGSGRPLGTNRVYPAGF